MAGSYSNPSGPSFSVYRTDSRPCSGPISRSPASLPRTFLAPAFCVLALIQTIFTAYVIVRDNPAGEQPTAAIIGMGGEAFAEFRDWISIVSAFANCTYCYVTGFITVEVTGEMTKPSDCYKAIYTAAIFM